MSGRAQQSTPLHARWPTGVVSPPPGPGQDGSTGRRGYTSIPDLLLDSLGELGVSLQQAMLLILLERYRYSGDGSKPVFPSQATLAKASGLCVKQIKRHVDALVALDLIEVHERTATTGFAGLSYTRCGLDRWLASRLEHGRLPSSIEEDSGGELAAPGGVPGTATPIDGGTPPPARVPVFPPPTGGEEEINQKKGIQKKATETVTDELSPARGMSPQTCVEVVQRLWGRHEDSPRDLAAVRAWAERQPRILMADIRQKLDAARPAQGEPPPLRFLFEDGWKGATS